MNYMELLIALSKYDKNAMQEIANKCFIVKESWDDELHDTKKVAAKVLELLGPEWEEKVDNAVYMYNKKAIEESKKNLGLTYLPPFAENRYSLPSHGRDRTRTLKYAINYILDEIYAKDTDFKYYKKYNPEKNVYTVWKDSKFKNKTDKSQETKNREITYNKQDKYDLQVLFGNLEYYGIFYDILNNNINDIYSDEEIFQALKDGDFAYIISWEASLESCDTTIELTMGLTHKGIKNYQPYYKVSVDLRYTIGDFNSFDTAFTVFKNMLEMHTNKYSK